MRRALGVVLLVVAGACAPAGPPPGPLAQVEAAYRATRTFADQLDVTRARAADTSVHGVTLDSLARAYAASRARLLETLALVDSTPLGPEDRRALRVILSTVDRALGESPAPAVDDAGAAAPSCEYAARSLLAPGGDERELVGRIFACYGAAAQDVRLGEERLDRLTVFGLLGTTDDRARRRALFLALQPVWRSVNGDDGPDDSPWRVALGPRAEGWRAGEYPHVARARALGIPADSVEPWLVRVLEAWRANLPDSPVEPWDWYYRNGEMSRRLSPGVGLDDLLRLNHEWYRSLGADPDALGIRYDVVPRPGKYPIAYSTFGARPHRTADGWDPGEPWVFASYRVGGVDNLGELLHETGHGVHIAAIRTRPAFAEWPDSDTFTEALAELASLDLTEPAWQIRHLGDSVPLAAGLRARYGSVVLDVAWALFEIRMFRGPGQSPNAVWADITSRYLGVRPHPEWSWWAMRGQLINSPGYMLNYALGAILVADLRARILEERGRWEAGDPGWYAWVSERLYRFGLERPTAEVVAEFLGRPVSPAALLADLARGRPGG